jgi:mannitol/fructose-specific phosphotransferase system IIA component (Ntr-type)
LAGDIKKQGIGLITLKKPVKWGNENVSIVLMLSIDVKNQNSFLELFSEVVDLMKTPKMIEGILSSEKFNEVINLLKG